MPVERFRVMGTIAEAVLANDLFGTRPAPLRHGRTTGSLSDCLLPDSRESARAGRRFQTSFLDPDYHDPRVQSPDSHEISEPPSRSRELRYCCARSKR